MPFPFSSFLAATPGRNPDAGIEQTIEQAIEQASAPNLSQTQRLQKLVESVFIPTLHIQEPSGRETHGMSPQLAAIQRFQATPEYASFKSVISNTFRQLDEIAKSSPDRAHQAGQFQRFAQEVFVPVSANRQSRYGGTQADLLVQSCPDASRILRMHNFAKQHPDLVAEGGAESARACITELSQRLNVCGPGLVQHFDDAVKTIRQLAFVPSMPERVEDLRVQMVRNCITEFLNKSKASQWTSAEVHQVAAWQNYFAKMFLLPTIQDVYASVSYTEEPENQEELTTQISALQSVSLISETLAGQVLEEARDLWHQAKAGGTTDLATYSMTLLNKISNKHGPVAPHALFVLDDDCMPKEIHKDPTLLALSILDEVDKSGHVNCIRESPHQWTPSHQNAYETLSLKNRGKLWWMETSPPPGSSEKPERNLMSAELMTPQQLKELFNALRQPERHDLNVRGAIHAIIRNDFGEELPLMEAMEHNKQWPDDVFIHLALGISATKKLGPPALRAVFKDLVSRAWGPMKTSPVADKQYIGNDFYHFFTYIKKIWNPACENRRDQIPLNDMIYEATKNDRTVTNGTVLRAAHTYQWIKNRAMTMERSVNNPILHGPATLQAESYIMGIKVGAPNQVINVARNNIHKMTSPKLILQLFDEIVSNGVSGRDLEYTLDELVRLDNDRVLLEVLEGLEQRGYHMRRIGKPSVTNNLRLRGLFRSAYYLDRHLADSLEDRLRLKYREFFVRE